jgi:hypothetical protein
MRTVSANALRAMLAENCDEVFLVCLTVNHSSFSTPYLLVNDQKPLTRTAGTFQPFAFDASMPNEEEDQVPTVLIAIDNIDTAILNSIRTIGAERPSVKMEVVLASSPNTVEAGPFNFAVLDISYDATIIHFQLGFEDDLLNTIFPASSYTPVNSKGLFA